MKTPRKLSAVLLALLLLFLPLSAAAVPDQPARVHIAQETPPDILSEVLVTLWTEDPKQTLASLNEWMDKAGCLSSWQNNYRGLITVLLNFPQEGAEAFLASVAQAEIRSTVTRKYRPADPTPSSGREAAGVRKNAGTGSAKPGGIAYILSYVNKKNVRISVSVWYTDKAARAVTRQKRSQLGDEILFGILEGAFALIAGIIRKIRKH